MQPTCPAFWPLCLVVTWPVRLSYYFSPTATFRVHDTRRILADPATLQTMTTTMSSLPHLQIFTTGDMTAHSELSFSLFSQLPKEVRLKIWQDLLRRQRIINIHLHGPTEQTAAQGAESGSSTHTSAHYRAVVDGYQVLSKLLRVNSESREAALEFYRVHLPCTLRRGSLFKETEARGILHFNPEYDFLHITPHNPIKDTLVDFLYHLKTTYDPQQIGLLNLAVDLNDLSGNDLYKLEPSDLDADAKTAFVDTLMQLREVFFMSTPRVGRQAFGLMGGLSTSEILRNRSLPIMAEAPSFKRLHRDPRPITQDLKKILVHMFFPRHIFDRWMQLLQKLTVSPTQIEYRCLLGFKTGESQGIYDRESANKWLQLEESEWNKTFGLSSNNDTSEKGEEKEKGPFSDIKWPVRPLPERFRNEDLSQAVKPAFGFWLFPIEVVKVLPEEESCYGRKEVLDMTNHWPELALMKPS